MTKKYFAELIGTMVLVLIGCGSAVLDSQYIGNVGIALAFGLAVITMVYAVGSISGAHFNPAITFGMLISKRISTQDALMYILFQIIGAIIGTVILMIMTGQNMQLGQNMYSTFPLASVFIGETIATFIFVFVVIASTSKSAPMGFAGIAIGLALTMVHLFLIPVDGTSVNPARSLGPALFTGGIALQQIWLFILAPLLGGAIAAFVWKGIEPETEK